MGADGMAPLDFDTLEDLYHRAPCGFLSARLDGTILRVNATFLEWTGFAEDEVLARHLVDLLTPAGKLFYETHYAPLVHLRREARDVAFDICRADGSSLPVLISARVVDDVGVEPVVVRMTVFDDTSRRDYERELMAARRRSEASERQMAEIARELQRSLLDGEPARGAGFTIETRYRPADEALEVGGDWYDSFFLPGDERVSLSVGDVVGRGISAACAMGQIRSALRALSFSGSAPGPLLDQLDAFVERVDDAHSATVVCAEVELATGKVCYSCAGHLPPLVLAPDGSTTYLWEGRSTPLAAIPIDGPRGEAEARLEPGSRLLLFTDGLVERRDRGLDDGMAVLARRVADLAPLTPAEMTDALMASMLHNEQVRDDVCLLCFAYEGPS